MKNKLPFTLKVDEHITLKIRQAKESKNLFDLVSENKKHLRTWLPWVDATKSIADSRKFIVEQIKQYQNGDACDFGIYYDNVLIGSGGFNKISKNNRAGEIGYWIAKKWEGRGIITKLVSSMISLGKARYNLHRIVIKAATENVRSNAVPKRLRFTHEGTLRHSAIMREKFIDLEVWSLLI